MTMWEGEVEGGGGGFQCLLDPTATISPICLYTRPPGQNNLNIYLRHFSLRFFCNLWYLSKKYKIISTLSYFPLSLTWPCRGYNGGRVRGGDAETILRKCYARQIPSAVFKFNSWPPTRRPSLPPALSPS